MSEAESIWAPTGAVGALALRRVFMAIVGTSGVGKSHLVSQLCEDPDFGPDEVFVFMAANSVASYGKTPPTNVLPVEGFASVLARCDEFASAEAAGKRLPKIVVLDNETSLADQQRILRDADPIMSAQKGTRDKLAEFGDMADRGIELLIQMRRKIRTDVIVLVETAEPAGAAPEILLPGRILPKRFTGLTDVTLYMRAEQRTFADYGFESLDAWRAKGEAALAAPHRTLGKDDAGKLDGTLINRFFLTQNDGEVICKGHRNLGMKERAYLPDILRRIHAA